MTSEERQQKLRGRWRKATKVWSVVLKNKLNKTTKKQVNAIKGDEEGLSNGYKKGTEGGLIKVL